MSEYARVVQWCARHNSTAMSNLQADPVRCPRVTKTKRRSGMLGLANKILSSNSLSRTQTDNTARQPRLRGKRQIPEYFLNMRSRSGVPRNCPAPGHEQPHYCRHKMPSDSSMFWLTGYGDDKIMSLTYKSISSSAWNNVQFCVHCLLITVEHTLKTRETLHFYPVQL